MFLATSDIVSLLTSVLPMFLLNGPEIDIKGTSSVICKTVHFVSYVAGGVSFWLLVLLSVERMLLSKFPVTAKAKFTHRNTFRCATCVILMNTVLFSHLPFGMDIQLNNVTDGVRVRRSECDFASVSYATFFETMFSFIVLFVFLIVPMILIIISNTVILVAIYAQRRKMRKVEPSIKN